MSDYERIIKIIRHIDEHQEAQPTLEWVAQQAGMSASHVQRLLSAWAGIAPADVLERFTAAHARNRLQAGHRALDTAGASGHFEPERLDKPCIKLKAATPAEINAAGAGWTITAGYAETPFGGAFIAESPRGICYLSFDSNAGRQEMRTRWPNAERVYDNRRAGQLCRQIFRPGQPPPTQTAPLQLFVKGTTFQVRVWQALLQVPVGALVSYGHLARFVGHPNAARAVGTAVGSNPIAYLIPCHRVIRETGAVGGYRWGTDRKRALLAWESG